ICDHDGWLYCHRIYRDETFAGSKPEGSWRMGFAVFWFGFESRLEKYCSRCDAKNQRGSIWAVQYFFYDDVVQRSAGISRRACTKLRYAKDFVNALAKRSF